MAGSNFTYKKRWLELNKALIGIIALRVYPQAGFYNKSQLVFNPDERSALKFFLPGIHENERSFPGVIPVSLNIFEGISGAYDTNPLISCVLL